eukprot:scaffold14146_cov125-Isochrysis_galbana.AAC.1
MRDAKRHKMLNGGVEAAARYEVRINTRTNQNASCISHIAQSAHFASHVSMVDAQDGGAGGGA